LRIYGKLYLARVSESAAIADFADLNGSGFVIRSFPQRLRTPQRPPLLVFRKSANPQPVGSLFCPVAGPLH
jgi:hypothetical protein